MAATRSQGGSGVGLALSCCPTCQITKFVAQLFRVVLAGVDSHLTLWATTAQGFWGKKMGSGERGRSHLPRRRRSSDHHRAVAEVAAGMAEDLKWSPCLEAPSWPSAPPS